jgi:hypothetical protein
MGSECFPHFCNKSEPYIFFQNWISQLPDNLKLSQMTIPGTHNSCSFQGTPLAITQSYSLELQLKAGLRYFDLRLRPINNKLKLQHGIIEQKMEFSDCLKIFRNFLKEKNKEFIIIHIQHEYEDSNSKPIQELFPIYIQNYKDIIMEYKGENFTVKEMRGKLIYIDVFNRSVRNIPKSSIQNNWVVNIITEVYKKKRDIKKHFNRSIYFYDDNKIYINFLSASSDYLLSTPAQIAKVTNKIPFKYKGKLGIVLCDFPGEKLIGHLINMNIYFYNNYILKNNDDIIIQNGMIVNLIHLNTNKYLNINKDNLNELYISNNINSFFLNFNSYNNYNDDNLISGSVVVLSNLRDITVKIHKVYNKGGKKDNNNFDLIKHRDIIKIEKIEIINGKIEPKKSFLKSDYSDCFKKNKIKNIKSAYFENKNISKDTIQWIIEINDIK